MTHDPTPDAAELHRAADERLDPARREAVAARLAADPEAAARVAFYRGLNAALHRLYDPLLDEPAPVVLPPRRAPILPRLGRAAAIHLLVLAGAAGGWLARDRLPGFAASAEEAQIARLAADAHRVYAAEIRHPVEVGADQEAHLVQWLSKRLGAEVRAPDLGPQGFRLMGGRLLPAAATDVRGDGPAAAVAGQFMYENDAGVRATLYLVSGRARDESAFRFTEEDGVSVFYWRDGGFGYALSAALPREELLALCSEVYAQLNPEGGGGAAW